MGRIRILGLALVAVVALTAVMASSAAAVPTWFECGKAAKVGKTYTGKFSDKECKTGVETGGKYELKEGLAKGKAFKGKSGPTVLHVKTYLGDNKVECGASKSSGNFALPNLETNVVVSYSKCKALTVKTCTSPGAKKGEIKTKPLRGELGYIEESPVNVGLLLESEAEPGGLLAEFSCENLEGKVSGEVIGELTKNTNVISKNTEVVDVSAERIGEHEFEGKKIQPDRQPRRFR